MLQVNLHEARTRLAQLVQAALDGEDVRIARAGKPAVRLVPVVDTAVKTTGYGSLTLSPDALDAAFDPAVKSSCRQPPPDIAGKGEILGDIVAPVVPEEDWDVLR